MPLSSCFSRYKEAAYMCIIITIVLFPHKKNFLVIQLIQKTTVYSFLISPPCLVLIRHSNNDKTLYSIARKNEYMHFSSHVLGHNTSLNVKVCL